MKQTLFKPGSKVTIEFPDIYSSKKGYNGREGVLLEIAEFSHGWTAKVQLGDRLLSCCAEYLRAIPDQSLPCMCVRSCPFRRQEMNTD